MVESREKKKKKNRKEDLERVKEEGKGGTGGEETENEEAVMTYLNPSSPKVIALYEAVRALSVEGVDLTQLKVSEIAARAGIGKGTTYEYFKSREELIVKAILYNMYHHIQSVENKMKQVEGFRRKIDVVLDTLFEQDGPDQNLFQRMMPFFHDIGSFPIRFHEELKKCAPCSKMQFDSVSQVLLEDAQREGVIQEGINLFYMQMALFNLVLDYAIYRKRFCCPEMMLSLSDAEMRQRLYENLIYALRK